MFASSRSAAGSTHTIARGPRAPNSFSSREAVRDGFPGGRPTRLHHETLFVIASPSGLREGPERSIKRAREREREREREMGLTWRGLLP
eukprot:14317276-Alexandrium_andersonii.AAC.1